MEKYSKEEFSKIVDETYEKLGIIKQNKHIRRIPNRGTINKSTTQLYSSDRAEGYASQKAFAKLNSN